ncbi:MAG TPA: cell wall hydrolase [Pseudolabrys sp.]|nr:cell wall hydrolase [Pseudolabrys sp.]
MLTRSIDFDASDQTIEEKVFVAAKRSCIVFAIFALTISALDLLNVRAVEAAAEFVHDRSVVLTSLRQGLQNFSLPFGRREEENIAMAFVAVPIPPDTVALDKTHPSVNAMIRDLTDSPVAKLAALRQEDAVEAAMTAGPAMASAAPAASAADDRPIQLASIDSSSIPREATPAVLDTPIALPQTFAMLPPPAPGVPPPSPIERLHLDGKSLARAERCLANAVYFEARDQPYKGQVAVAQVVMNRVFSGFYPEDVCGVIYQNADRHLACQFTFACDGKRKTINERGAWARANRIAKETLAGKLYEQAVGTATHYHALYVHPNWVREMHKLARYGIHSFYRPIAWGNGSDEPIWSKLALKTHKKN